MNKVILIGRLTKDPEIKYTSNSTAYCRFSLAVNRDKDNTDFIDCKTWKATAENLCKYQHKGSQICVEGSVRVDKYQTNEGESKTATYIDVYKVEFIGSSKAENKTEEIGGVPFTVEAMPDDDLPF